MKQAAEIVSVLFLSREQAHRAHLLTKSYEQHVALSSFYDAVIDLAARLDQPTDEGTRTKSRYRRARRNRRSQLTSLFE